MAIPEAQSAALVIRTVPKLKTFVFMEVKIFCCFTQAVKGFILHVIALLLLWSGNSLVIEYMWGL